VTEPTKPGSGHAPPVAAPGAWCCSWCEMESIRGAQGRNAATRVSVGAGSGCMRRSHSSSLGYSSDRTCAGAGPNDINILRHHPRHNPICGGRSGQLNTPPSSNEMVFGSIGGPASRRRQPDGVLRRLQVVATCVEHGAASGPSTCKVAGSNKSVNGSDNERESQHARHDSPDSRSATCDAADSAVGVEHPTLIRWLRVADSGFPESSVRRRARLGLRAAQAPSSPGHLLVTSDHARSTSCPTSGDAVANWSCRNFAGSILVLAVIA